MNILSLFDGLSGARIALERAGIKVEKYYASEVDKYAIQVSRKNYPDIIQLGDINLIDFNSLPKINLLIGGSPCQDLSISKQNRQGLNGERSKLFYKFVEAKEILKPDYFLLENVNSMSKENKDIITKILGVEPIMINSALVSAQNRKRLYWTNILGITQPEDKQIFLKDILEKNVSTEYNTTSLNELNWILNPERIKKQYTKIDGDEALTLMARTYANWNGTYTKRIGQINKGGQGDRIYSIEGKLVNLSANGGGRGAKTGLYLIKGVAQRTRDKGYKETEIRKDEKSNALTTVQTDSMLLEQDIVRKLTPLECERLQTIPDNYTEGVSNSQRYKMIGNGFTIDVINHILKGIK